MKLPKLRSIYDTEAQLELSNETALHCEDKTLAQQHFADECDINKLVARYVVTGNLPQLTLPPMAGDFTNVPDMQTALDLIVLARQSFMQLPANVRARFAHDPAQFVTFCSDETNRDEMRQMGLWSPEAAARFTAEQVELKTLAEEGKAARAAQKAPPGPTGDTPKGVT